MRQLTAIWCASDLAVGRGADVSREDLTRACGRAEKWLTEHEPEGLEIFVRPISECRPMAGVFEGSPRELRGLARDLTDHEVELLGRAWEHAIQGGEA